MKCQNLFWPNFDQTCIKNCSIFEGRGRKCFCQYRKPAPDIQNLIKICYNFGQIILKIYISASKFDKLFLIWNKFWSNLYQNLLNFWRSGAEIFLSIQKTCPRYSKFDQNLIQFWLNRNKHLCYGIKIWQIISNFEQILIKLV